MIIQFTGLSGSGKSTLAQAVKGLLETEGRKAQVLDGDEYRRTLCKDLGYSKEDRCENIRRLGKLAFSYSREGFVCLIAAINPFESARATLVQAYGAKTVWIRCATDVLRQRDTKGLYRRAGLPDFHPDKIFNLTGINDVFEEPFAPDLIIDTDRRTVNESVATLYRFILQGAGAAEALSFPVLHTL